MTSSSPPPAKQVCPICAFDDDVESVNTPDGWVMTCTAESHGAFSWPATPQQTSKPGRFGVGEELGVYDDLLACMTSELAEYGVIEYRYSQRSPAAYRQLVERYGHRSVKPQKHTASVFLGGALGHLYREGAIAGTPTKATGYWSYNSGTWWSYGPASAAMDHPEVLSWEAFATQNGFDPMSWPFAEEALKP